MSAVLNLSEIRSNKQSRKTQYETEFDPEYGVLWGYFDTITSPHFSLNLLNDIRSVDTEIEKSKGIKILNGKNTPINYYVIASSNPSIFNLGGDLGLFSMLIKLKDKESLLEYARLCINNLYPRIQNYQSQSLTTISLVQGDALGGGFETALSSNIIVAEEQAKMGFPEILFNLFPGMGAYSFLARKVGVKVAEELISSGEILSASDLRKLGVVDVVAPTGMGEAYVYDYIKTNHRRRNGLQAMHRARDLVNPITYEELFKITELWVDAALRLEEKDIKMMHRLVRAQSKRTNESDISRPTMSSKQAQNSSITTD